MEITIKSLTKRFGDVTAVKNFSLSISDKEFIVLVGPSGCGKSTTLRCIAGLEAPDEGEIYIRDRLVNDIAPKDRNVAMVFQNYAVYPHMTVFQNISFPLKMRKLPKDEIKKRVKKTAELLGIDHLLDRKPSQISGGETQRVALGRAIVREPVVFLLDEPLSNLDAKLRARMRMEIKRLQRDLGVTTIHVTHDQVEAMTMADRIVVMNKGEIQQLGTPNEVYTEPANLFTADFIGSPAMNLVDCALMEMNGTAVLDAGFFKLRISDDVKEMIETQATSPKELVLGFRPMHAKIVSLHRASADFHGEVYTAEDLGSETLVNVKVGDYLVRVVTNQSAAGFQVYGSVAVSIDIDKIHIFDKKTGTRIG